MKIINQSIEIIDKLDGPAILKKIELCGRVCYKSEDKITDRSAEKFVKSITDSKHESVLEHESVTIKATTDRATANQLVRHRISSYSQESQRYCNYAKDKFDNEVTFIESNISTCLERLIWEKSLRNAEKSYFELIKYGVTPEVARGVLPNDTKTEIIITKNLRAWREFLTIRTDRSSQKKIRDLSFMILKEFKKNIKIVFDDIKGEDE